MKKYWSMIPYEVNSRFLHSAYGHCTVIDCKEGPLGFTLLLQPDADQKRGNLISFEEWSKLRGTKS